MATSILLIIPLLFELLGRQTLALAELDVRRSLGSCRCFPDDSCWPTIDEWDLFNVSIGGKLISTIPIAAVCHHDTFAEYDAEACDALQNAWYDPATHVDSPSSVMAPLFTYDSCNPFENTTAPCTLGNYVSYSVNASGADDYQKTLEFVRTHNIRLVIKNTGHEYNGKSTGSGALGLWTHHLKTMELRDYNTASYSGKAFKFGAGVQAIEAYEFADSHGLTVVGANEPTVGFAGGYSQGGGHGPLASFYGLAADQVLEWEVVIASGEVVTASATSSEYADLYWALAGGGPGTFGAVLSVTVKAHPPMILSVASMAYTISNNNSAAFWEAVGSFTEYVPSINDAGAVAIWYIQDGVFDLATLWGPNLEKTDLDSLLQPFLTRLDSLGISYSYSSEQYPSFLEGFQSVAPIEVANLLIGGRLIPGTLVETDNKALTAALQNITDAGAVFSGVSFNVSHHSADSVGANPYWRQSVFDAAVGFYFDYTDWESNIQNQDIITNDLIPSLAALTPGGGTYLNEADFQQPDWESTFYGAHWDQLSAIKSKYDPSGVFYALKAVGSEGWTQKTDGRLCQV